MNNLLTICRREIAAYFNSAIAYIFIIVFVLLNGGLFMTQFFLISRADMRPFFSILPFVLAVFLPAVSMRLWAEERRGNTLELLLTFPMPTYQLVLGKFIASLVFFLAALVSTMTIPIMLQILGRPDMGVIMGGYAGAFFLGAFFLAVGIFISGLCRDQIVAFILSMLVCFGFHLVGTEFFASSLDGWVSGLGSFLRHFIGSAGHFDSFSKGVIAGSDVVYFSVGVVLFLVLNGFWLEGRMRPGAKKIFTSAVVISAGIFMMSNWLLAGVSLGRLDLTESKLYTISEATKRILRELPAPVTAKFYISPMDKMPTGMKTLEQDVVDKLDELRVAANGNFEYKIFRMEAANVVEGQAEGEEESLEQQLQRKGIQPFQVRAVESDEVAVRLIYSSLSLAYKDKPDEIVPRIVPGNFTELEYIITSKIYRMTLAKAPKVAIVAPYEVKEVQAELKALLSQLGQATPDDYREDHYELLPMALQYEGYEVERIKLNQDEMIADDVDTLVVVEPLNLNERQLWEINRFLVNGGSVFLAVQNYEYQYNPAGRDVQIYGQDKKPQVNSLLSQWGFEVDKDVLVDKQHDVINLSGGARIGPFQVNVPVKIPIQVLIPQSGMNPDISITSRLSSMFYLWGTALTLNDDKIKEQGLEVKTLLNSSKDSWTVPFKNTPLNPDDLSMVHSKSQGPLPLAVMVQGQFKDGYANKDVPAWPATEVEASEGEDVGEAKPDLMGEPGKVMPAPGKLILVGASSFFQKHLVKGGGNLPFFMNSVDAITLGDDLVTIRSKKPIDRSLSRLSAASKVSWRLFSTIFIPVVLAIIGFARVFLRRQAKQNYLKKLVTSS